MAFGTKRITDLESKPVLALEDELIVFDKASGKTKKITVEQFGDTAKVDTNDVTNVSTATGQTATDALNSLNSFITNVESQAASNLTDVQTDLQNQIDTITGGSGGPSLTTLDTRLTQAETEIDAVEGVNTTQNGRLTSLETRMTSAESITAVSLVDADFSSNGFMKRTGSGVYAVSASVNLNSSDVSNTLPVTKGGTGSTTASSARTALGLAIGTDIQAYNTNLTELAGLAKTKGNIAVANGMSWTVLSPGANGKALFSDSTSSTGYKWDTAGNAVRYVGTFAAGVTTVTLPATANTATDLLVIQGGVPQVPTSYSVAGTTLTFASATLADGFYILTQSEAVQVGIPTDLSVTTNKIVDGIITFAKMAASALATTAAEFTAAATSKLATAAGVVDYVTSYFTDGWVTMAAPTGVSSFSVPLPAAYDDFELLVTDLRPSGSATTLTVGFNNGSGLLTVNTTRRFAHGTGTNTFASQTISNSGVFSLNIASVNGLVMLSGSVSNRASQKRITLFNSYSEDGTSYGVGTQGGADTNTATKAVSLDFSIATGTFVSGKIKLRPIR